MDGNESTPARPHGDAGTKAATAADETATEGSEGPAAPPDNSPSTTRDQAGAPPSPATAEGQPSPSTPADPVVPPPPAPAPASAPASPPPAEPTAPGPPPYGAARPAEPKIFDLPDHDTGRRGNGADRPLVLGGAAAAEGRTSGSHPRIAGPATPPGGDGAAAEDEDQPRGRHFAAAGAALTDRWPLLVAAVPALVLVLLIGSWAIDTAALSGQVMRNVQVAGRDVGGLGEASLPDVMDEINDELAARPVVVTSDDRRYETTAGEIGLTVDTEATAQAALDAGRSDSLLTRPLRVARLVLRRAAMSMSGTPCRSRRSSPRCSSCRAPSSWLLTIPRSSSARPAGWRCPACRARGSTPTRSPRSSLRPPTAAAAASGDGDDDDDPISVEAALVEVAPRFTDAEAQELADQANAMTANGLTLTAGETSKPVGPETLRTWIAPTTANGALELTIVADAVNAAVPEVFSDLSAEPKNASFDLQNGVPVVIPSQQGVVCCGANSADLVWEALSTGQTSAALEVQATEPEITTEEAQGLGIVQPVGGNNAWRNGAATTAGPGFTTYYDAGQPRVTNIHRIADIVRGTIILPGETFSVNETVGQRTAAKGFVLAGAIREGDARRRDRWGRLAVRHHDVQRRLLRGPRHPHLPGAHRVVLALPTRTGSDHGLPRARPQDHEQHALRRDDLDVIHGQQHHGDDVLDALRHGRADRHQRVDVGGVPRRLDHADPDVPRRPHRPATRSAPRYRPGEGQTC